MKLRYQLRVDVGDCRKMAVKMKMCVVLLLLLLSTLTTRTWAQLDDDDMMEESLDTDVSLDEFDLEETCAEVAEAKWNYYLNPTKQNLQKKIDEEQKYGDELRREAERMTFNLQVSLKSSELQRKIELLAKPGAPLLGAENFNKMVVFSNNLEDLKHTKYNICSKSIIEKGCEMNLQDVQNSLAKTHNAGMLLHIWNEYSAKWLDASQNFSAVLQLANEEATLSGATDVEKYWEDITEFPPGYKRAVSLWKQIQPLYEQLQQSISSLISKRYKIQNKATIPLIYLGSISGTDWSSVADIIFSRSSSQYQYIKGKLREKELSSLKLYRAAENMVARLGLNKLSPHFWNESKFDQSCPTKTISFCKEIRITTCKQPSWSEYMNAHKIIVQAAHRHAVEESFIFRENNHHSALYEAVSGLGPLLAASPKQLELQGLLPPTEEHEDGVKYTFLILMALQTLPQLPYYLAADMWRLEAIKNNETDPMKLKNSWIKLREEMQMVSVPENSNDWFQLLTDPYIVNNKPYLGKFLGVILQFQLLEHFLDNMDITVVDAVHSLGSDDKFRSLLRSSFSRPWPDTVENIAKISYIDAKPLLNFFSELEDALNEEVDNALPADSRSNIMVTESVEVKEEPTEKETGDESSSTETEDKVESAETETETVTGIRLSDVQNQNVSAEIPSNTETESKTVESSGIGTILLFSITAAVAVIAIVVFFIVGRKRFIRSHIYRQPPDQNAPA